MPLFSRAVFASVSWIERRRRRQASREGSGQAKTLITGQAGESLAYWFLRREGYVVVARNLRLRPGAGELDLVAWDRATLAFVEVKTRTSDAAGPPEMAVSENQKIRIARAAAIYMRRLKRKAINYRFDVVSVAWNSREGYQLKLIKNAFTVW
ncbi:MAG: YraN family protein [Terriglobia bacterium]